ncbi:unnamed protein product [Amoebophrya sp. A120]|nr:unnamed protein product [Amoebophrya sp. A120]|eukprot:GSA120T00014512001.1
MPPPAPFPTNSSTADWLLTYPAFLLFLQHKVQFLSLAVVNTDNLLLPIPPKLDSFLKKHVLHKKQLRQIFNFLFAVFLIRKHVWKPMQTLLKDHNNSIFQVAKFYVYERFLVQAVFQNVLKKYNLFGTRSKIEKEMVKMETGFDTELSKNLDATIITTREVLKQGSNTERVRTSSASSSSSCYTALPAAGLPKEKILQLLQSRADEDKAHWNNGKISGAVYYQSADLNKMPTKQDEPRSKTKDNSSSALAIDVNTVMKEAYGMFMLSNPLHSDLFNNCRQLEAEVIAMVGDLFTGATTSQQGKVEQSRQEVQTSATLVCGSLTTGGTESILMAMLSYRNKWLSENNIELTDPSNTRIPNIVLPVTAHAAFDKAALYFGIKLRKCGIVAGGATAGEQADVVDSTGSCRKVVPGGVNVAEMKKLVDEDTVAVVGSAPNYPNGAMDPLLSISDEIAVPNKIPFHVDACLGGFLLPFIELAGLGKTSQPFTFAELRGCTSISVDTHKYGFCAKGASVILYRNSFYRSFQFTAVPDWTGGIYATPTIAGSRNGGIAATTYAALVSFGRDGYVECTGKIVACARRIEAEIQEAAATKTTSTPAEDEPGPPPPRRPLICQYLQQLGKCDTSVVCLASRKPKEVNIYAIASIMREKFDWNLNSLQNPPSIHLCVTLPVAVADYVLDETTKESESRFVADLEKSVEICLADPAWNKKAAAGVYGMAASIPNSLAGDLTKVYLDSCYKVQKTVTSPSTSTSTSSEICGGGSSGDNSSTTTGTTPAEQRSPAATAE